MPPPLRGTDDWASADLGYQQPHCPRCHVVMRDIPGGWWCPSCLSGLLLTTGTPDSAAVSHVGPRETRLRRGA